MRTSCIGFGFALASLCMGVQAQETQKPEATVAAASAPAKAESEDAKAITALVAEFTKAFNAGNAKAAAATFTEDAIVVDEEDNRTIGRAAIEEQLADSFKDQPGRSIVIETLALRFLSPATALEEGKTIVKAAKGGTPEVTRFTVVYVKQNGAWLQAAVRDEQQPVELTAHDHLKQLEWMVGEWTNESEDAIVHTTCKWADEGNFLVRDFTMQTRGKKVLSGTQRIGWDPTRKQLKTWIFDSQGGFGEGYWTRNGDQWVIKAEGVRQDGLHASVTNVITRLGKDRAHWHSADRTLGGVAVPGVDEFTIVRKPPEVGKK